MQAALSDAARDVVFESFKMKEFTSRFVDEEAMNISILHNFKLMICNMPKRYPFCEIISSALFLKENILSSHQ